MATSTSLTEEEFLAEFTRLERAGDPQALHKYSRQCLPQVEDQLSDEELDALCAGSLETASMLVQLQKADPRDFADHAPAAASRA